MKKLKLFFLTSSTILLTLLMLGACASEAKLTDEIGGIPKITLKIPADNAVIDLSATDKVSFAWTDDNAAPAYVLEMSKVGSTSGTSRKYNTTVTALDIVSGEMDVEIAGTLGGAKKGEEAQIQWSVSPTAGTYTKAEVRKFGVKRIPDDTPPPVDPEQPSTDQLSDNSGQQIPIFAWYGFNTNAPEERWADMKAAGFTISQAKDMLLLYNDRQDVFAGGSSAVFFSGLDAAAAHGIQLVVTPRVFDFLSPADVNKLKAHPGLWGYHIADEPRTVAEFAEINSTINKAKSFDNTHPCYVNLAGCLHCDDATPNSWAPTLSAGPAFPEPSPCIGFVKSFVDAVPVPMLSFDVYPIWVNTNTNQRELQKRWYYTLDVMSAESKRKNIPLWAFALTTAHFNSGYPYPIPTKNDLRLQVYSNLAYGAQLIAYFTYEYTPQYNGTPWEGPFTESGTKTSTYYTMKGMNEEFIPLSAVFLNAEMIWAAHTGEIPAGCTELDRSKLPSVFQSLDITGGKGALVSLMKKGNDNFLVIVNHDINEDISVQVSGTAALRRVKKDASVVIADNRVHTVTPGDVLIYFWK
ncbi:hypothetical protein FACS1894199_07020 [Bacteroidia bacterium]|nr:hypothetical protein FACS1894199_07020 [Bacteroidia bacterium]